MKKIFFFISRHCVASVGENNLRVAGVERRNKNKKIDNIAINFS